MNHEPVVDQPPKDRTYLGDAWQPLVIILIGLALCIVDVNIGSSPIVKSFTFGWRFDIASDVLGYAITAFGLWSLLRFNISESYLFLLRVAMVIAICNAALELVSPFIHSGLPIFQFPGLMFQVISLAGIIAFVTAMMEFARVTSLHESLRTWRKAQFVTALWIVPMAFRTVLQGFHLYTPEWLAFNAKQFVKWFLSWYGLASAATSILAIITMVFLVIALIKTKKEIDTRPLQPLELDPSFAGTMKANGTPNPPKAPMKSV